MSEGWKINEKPRSTEAQWLHIAAERLRSYGHTDAWQIAVQVHADVHGNTRRCEYKHTVMEKTTKSDAELRTRFLDLSTRILEGTVV